MDRNGSGTRLIILSGILEGIKYLSAAIYMSGSASQSRELFESGLKYVGMKLDVFAAAALLLGAAIIVYEEFERRTKPDSRKRKGH